MALLDQTGTILVDDANLVWRRPAGSGMNGLEGLDDLGFNWEGFGQAAAGIGGSIAAIVSAKKGIAPIQPVGGGLAVSGSGLGASGGFSMNTTTMLMFAAGALLLVMVMKK